MSVYGKFRTSHLFPAFDHFSLVIVMRDPGNEVGKKQIDVFKLTYASKPNVLLLMINFFVTLSKFTVVPLTMLSSIGGQTRIKLMSFVSCLLRLVNPLIRTWSLGGFSQAGLPQRKSSLLH